MRKARGYFNELQIKRSPFVDLKKRKKRKDDFGVFLWKIRIPFDSRFYDFCSVSSGSMYKTTLKITAS